MNAESVFASVAIKTLARSGANVAVMPEGGAPLVLDKVTYDLLTLTTRFRTLNEHAATCYDKLQPSKSRSTHDVLCMLQNLVERKLLRPVSEIFGPGQSYVATEPRPKVSSISVVTKDRPASLLRCVDSVMSVLYKYERRVEVCIYDDSENGSSDTVRDVLAKWPEIPLRYSGWTEKFNYLEALERTSGIPRDVLEFALSGAPPGLAYGANQNCVLADTAGTLTMTVDDDVICRMGAAPEQSNCLAFSCDFDPTCTRLFASRATALASVSDSAIDFIAEHEELLGNTVASCLANSGDVDLANARSSLRALTHPHSCTVAATMSGLVGDSGFQDCSWMHVDGQLQNDLLQSEDMYRSLRHASNVARYTSRPTITDGQFFMTTMAGLDNRNLLPPFMPVLRNQDGIFGSLLRACWPDVMIGHIPWLAIHDPMPQYTPPRKPAVRGPRFADLLNSVIRECRLQSSGTEPEKRLRRIGEELFALSALDSGNFRSWLDTACSRHWASDLLWHQSLLQRGSDRPELWRRDVANVIRQLEHALTANWRHVFDLAHGASESAGEKQIQQLFGGYGRLLQCWPSVVDACRELRNQGVRMTRDLSENRKVQVQVPGPSHARPHADTRGLTCLDTSCATA